MEIVEGEPLRRWS